MISAHEKIYFNRRGDAMVSIVGKRRPLMYSDVESALKLENIFPAHQYWNERNINMMLRRSLENVMQRVKVVVAFDMGTII